MTTHRLERVSSADEAFVGLVRQLDADLAIRDGDENAFYAQFNGLEAIQHAVVLYLNEVPAACGAIKEYDATSAEVKRMFTAPEFRGNRLGAVVLSALEDWAEELGYEAFVILEKRGTAVQTRGQSDLYETRKVFSAHFPKL